MEWLCNLVSSKYDCAPILPTDSAAIRNYYQLYQKKNKRYSSNKNRWSRKVRGHTKMQKN